ncbi:Septin-type guanine nucleotide-binding (G) domain [Trinorchestia longiramus]|nr:Septin-type guanine nucleotide-binding (G) domain [Trinorchestia longiramus]
MSGDTRHDFGGGMAEKFNSLDKHLYQVIQFEKDENTRLMREKNKRDDAMEAKNLSSSWAREDSFLRREVSLYTIEAALQDEKIRTLKLSGHVGFDSLPDQLVSKSTQNGFTFNILCIGETGMGKSTLMDTLFNTSFESTPASHSLPAVKLKSHTYELQESNVRLKLTIVDTVGYGDQVNKADSFTSIVDYIDKQFDDYLQEELKIRRSLNTAHDSRIHACLYFICPTGHGLKSIDLVCMKKLDSKVNIIPIIAKADTVSKVELSRFKARITQEIKSNGIHLYQFPTDDETIAKTNSEMNAQMPFAVVGSTDFVRVGNKMVRARQYPWGTVQVESESHCDFTKLREMLIRTNMEDMREVTHSCHYELYRKKMLEQVLIIRLKSIDLVCMKKLDSKVNIIPIIAKADTVSKVELSRFKARITQEIKSNGIHLYQFPTDDETIAKTNSEMNAQMPFAVVGSTDFVRVGNKMVRARQYPWGTVQVESESHCDFTKLREMLIRTNMEDMREVTHSCHYELYRKKMLEQMGFSDIGENNQPKSFQETFEQKREEHRAELQKKEDDMRQSFVLRVKEKETELKEVEKELYTKYDQLKREHAEEKKRYEMLKNRLEEERNEFTKRRAQLATAPASHHHTLTLGKKSLTPKECSPRNSGGTSVSKTERVCSRDSGLEETCSGGRGEGSETSDGDSGLVDGDSPLLGCKKVLPRGSFDEKFNNNENVWVKQDEVPRPASIVGRALDTEELSSLIDQKKGKKKKNRKKFPLSKWENVKEGRKDGFHICGLFKFNC